MTHRCVCALIRLKLQPITGEEGRLCQSPSSRAGPRTERPNQILNFFSSVDFLVRLCIQTRLSQDFAACLAAKTAESQLVKSLDQLSADRRNPSTVNTKGTEKLVNGKRINLLRR